VRRATTRAVLTAALALTVVACAPTSADNRAVDTPSGQNQQASASPGTQAPSNPAQVPTHPPFDAKKAWAHLEAQVKVGPRPSGTAAANKTRDYIQQQLKAAGVDSRLQVFIANTPLGETSMANVIATIPGRRPERIVLGSHFDTKRERDFVFVGANDGASSTGALLELARVLKQRRNEFTIELLFLDGEEAVIAWQGNDNTYGSRYYVENAQKSGTLSGIKAFVLLDMIGDRELVVRREAASTPWLVDIIWNAAGRIGHRATFSNEITAVEDDHIPFLRAGVAAADIIDLDNPTWHTARDTMEFVSPQSLQIVGDVVLAALPDIEQYLAR
jgi:glutaminyl-peptide cyclotransferase